MIGIFLLAYPAPIKFSFVFFVVFLSDFFSKMNVESLILFSFFIIFPYFCSLFLEPIFSEKQKRKNLHILNMIFDKNYSITIKKNSIIIKERFSGRTICKKKNLLSLMDSLIPIFDMDQTNTCQNFYKEIKKEIKEKTKEGEDKKNIEKEKINLDKNNK